MLYDEQPTSFRQSWRQRLRWAKGYLQVYGKYGTLAKRYLEDKGIDWTIANLPEYLHGVDKAADELYETMYEKFSKEERFKKSADFMENLKRETEMQRLIEEEILNEIVYVK